jgi:hypothetical protein
LLYYAVDEGHDEVVEYLLIRGGQELGRVIRHQVRRWLVPPWRL